MFTPHSHKAWMAYTCRCFLQDEKTTCAMKTEVAVGVGTVIEVRVDCSCYKFSDSCGSSGGRAGGGGGGSCGSSCCGGCNGRR